MKKIMIFILAIFNLTAYAGIDENKQNIKNVNEVVGEVKNADNIKNNVKLEETKNVDEKLNKVDNVVSEIKKVGSDKVDVIQKTTDMNINENIKVEEVKDENLEKENEIKNENLKGKEKITEVIKTNDNIKTNDSIKSNDNIKLSDDIKENNDIKPNDENKPEKVVDERMKNFKHLEDYKNIELDNLKFDIVMEEFARTYDNYVFVRRNSNIRELPTVKSKKISRARRNQKLKLLASYKNKIGEKWYKIISSDNKEGYIRSDLVIARKYSYEEAIKEIEKVNKFILENQDNMRVLSKYIPLDTSVDKGRDSKGNYANQTIPVYTNERRTKHYNLPDRALFVIIDQTKKYYIIKSPFYEENLYYPKKYRKYIRKKDINGIAKKFIFIDKHSQNQITFELDDENNYVVKLMSSVTTGGKSKFGFDTPSGYFSVAITKPVMKYIKDVDKEEEKKKAELEKEKNKDKQNDKKTEEEKPKIQIIGEAQYAIRFSGGAYMHGIPYLYEPENTIEQRKKATQSLLGTYGISHKCVRNYDSVVKYLYDWIEYSHVNRAGHRILSEEVIVIVK